MNLLRRPTAAAVADARQQLDIMAGFYDAILELRKGVLALGKTLAVAAFIVQTPSLDLPNAQALSALGTGLLKNTAGTGVLTIAVAGTDYAAPNLHYVTTQAETGLSNEFSLGAFASGVLQHIVTAGVSVPSAFAVGSGRIPFGTGANGQITDSANITFVSNNLVLNAGGVIIGPHATGTAMRITNPDSIGGFAQAAFYPDSGTNVTSMFSVIPRGTGASAINLAQFLIFNTDFVADATNYEFAGLRAAGTQFIVGTSRNGTGTLRPLLLSAGALDGATNSTQLMLNIDGSVTVQGTSVSDASVKFQVDGNANGPIFSAVANNNAGGSTSSGFVASNSQTDLNNYFVMNLFGTGFSTSGLLGARVGRLELASNTSPGNLIIGNASSSGDIVFYTTASRTERMRIATGGNVSVANLTAGGLVQAVAATGVLRIPTASVGGAATAGAAYGATEQTMLQKAYDCLRTFALLT